MKFRLCLVILLGLVSATPVFATEVLLSSGQTDPTTNKTNVETNQLVEVQVGLLPPDNQLSVNAVQATISYPADILTLKDVRDGDSIISAWIEKPDVSQAKVGAYAFSGIIAHGYAGNGYAALLTLDFEAKKTGLAKISTTDVQVLLNDGKGTPTPTSNTPLVISVSTKKALSTTSTLAAITDDHTPPQPFVIERAQDPNLFDGKWFVTFETQDKESGIDHYEVREQAPGQSAAPWVITTSPYVLQDQSLASQIEVKAVDKNGNERLAQFVLPSVASPRSTISVGMLSWSVFIVCALLAGLIFWHRRSKRVR